MKSKHVSETTTTRPRGTATAERSRPHPRTIGTSAVEKTKPTIIRIAAATPRIITTQPAIKAHPMPIALEEEEDLRPTFELLPPAASGKNDVEQSAARESMEREQPSRPAPDPKIEAQSVTTASGPRLGIRPTPIQAPSPLRTMRIASIAASITCVAAVTIVMHRGWGAGPTVSSRPIADTSSPASPRRVIETDPVARDETAPSTVRVEQAPVERPRVHAQREAETREPVPAPAETGVPASWGERAPRAPAPSERTMSATATLRSNRTARRFPSADDPNCLRRCHGDADCVVHCVRDDDPDAPASRSGMRVAAAVHGAPAVEDVRLALARLGGEVADCSNGSLTGQATVDVTFANTGHVTTAIVRLPFAGTAIGSCIARVVRSARVEPFTRRLLHVAYAYRIH